MNRTQHEVLAEQHAFNAQADYIDEAVTRHGFDIRQWPSEVFEGLAQVPVVSYQERLRDLALQDEGAIPF